MLKKFLFENEDDNYYTGTTVGTDYYCSEAIIFSTIFRVLSAPKLSI